jgi:hypothetical protein
MSNRARHWHFQLHVCGVVVAVAFTVPQIAAAQSVEVSEISLKRNCLDRGTKDHPLVGEAFEACLRKQIESLPALDPARREHFGERYDPQKYVECRMRPGHRNSSACNVFILRRREWPEYWPENAVRPKWPEAPKEGVYRDGMTPREYWGALCKAEAGEFFYKTVKGVEGFLLVRPRGAETDYAMQDKYVVEDAYGALEFQFVHSEARPGKGLFALKKANYGFVESGLTVASGRRMWLRHEIDFSRLDELLRKKPERWREDQFSSVSEISQPKSDYGITWRGIRRPKDIDMGISGGELAVVDLRSGETLALRRGFALDVLAAKGATSRRYWLSSAGCPVMRRESTTLSTFIRMVLSPKAH